MQLAGARTPPRHKDAKTQRSRHYSQQRSLLGGPLAATAPV